MIIHEFKYELKWLKNTISSFCIELNEQNPEFYDKTFWDITLHPNKEYIVPGISDVVRQKKFQERNKPMFYNCRLSKKLWAVVFENAMSRVNWKTIHENHKETFYSQKVLPWWWLKIPWRHVAEDGTVRDENWYICVAANYMPKWSEIMTTLWPGKVYDTWDMKWKRIDIYVDRA